jgi:hypothetical protein
VNSNNKIMKRNSIILILLLLAGVTFGQIKKSVEIPVNKNGDTTRLYKWINELNGQLKINKIIFSEELFHLRFWQDGQAIDIWTVDNKTFQGKVTNFVWEYKSSFWNKKKPKTGKLFSNQNVLDAGQARTAYNLFLIDSIAILPSEEKNPGWSKESEGITYCFEISTPHSYTFKSFWTPTEKERLQEAKKILDFVKNINAYLNLSQFKTKFYDTLPAGSYSDGSMPLILIPEKIKPDFYYDYDYDNDYEDYYLDYF